MTKKEALERFSEAIAGLQKMEELLQSIELDNIRSVDSDRIRVWATSINNLKDIRKYLRDTFSAKYSLASIFSSGGEMYATWNCEEVPIDIWFGSSPENFPEAFLKKGCHIEAVEHVKTEYNVVCPV